MLPKKMFFPLTVLFIIFVITGDRLTFLPYPVRNASYQSRTFVLGLWPDWLKPKDQNQQREQEIEKLQGQAPSQELKHHLG